MKITTNKINYLITTILCTYIHSGHALTLLEAQKTAQLNNSIIKQMNSEVEISRAKVSKALAPYFPQVNASARHLLDKKFEVMEINLGSSPAEFPVRQPLSQMTIGTSLLLFDSFGIWNNYKSAKHERIGK